MDHASNLEFILSPIGLNRIDLKYVNFCDLESDKLRSKILIQLACSGFFFLVTLMWAGSAPVNTNGKIGCD